MVFGEISCLRGVAVKLTLRLLMSYIYGAPSKARNANVIYIWTHVWQRWNSAANRKRLFQRCQTWVHIYTTLAFLASLGAPYIYEISSLRFKGLIFRLLTDTTGEVVYIMTLIVRFSILPLTLISVSFIMFLLIFFLKFKIKGTNWPWSSSWI